jgi:hypothetical protein
MKDTRWLIIAVLLFYAVIGYVIYDHYRNEKEMSERCKIWEAFDKSSPSLTEGERYWHEEYGLYCAEKLKKMKGLK